MEVQFSFPPKHLTFFLCSTYYIITSRKLIQNPPSQKGKHTFSKPYLHTIYLELLLNISPNYYIVLKSSIIKWQVPFTDPGIQGYIFFLTTKTRGKVDTTPILNRKMKVRNRSPTCKRSQIHDQTLILLMYCWKI